MRSTVGLSCITLLLLFLLSCSKEPLSVSTASSAKGTANIKLVASAGSAFNSLARSATALVFGDGMDTIRRSLSVNANSITGAIENIPAGANRVFQVFVYDTAGAVCYYGTAMAKVIANRTVNVPMTIYRWDRGNAVINGTITDSLPTPQCFVLDSTCFLSYQLGTRICYIRKICNGDTILDTVFHSGNVDTNQLQCYKVDSTCFFSPQLGTKVCYIRKVCKGDTLIDTVAGYGNEDTTKIWGCHNIDTTSFTAGGTTKWYIRKICNGATYVDTVFGYGNVDTTNQGDCYKADSTCFTSDGRTICYIRTVCHGVTLIDTVASFQNADTATLSQWHSIPATSGGVLVTEKRQ